MAFQKSACIEPMYSELPFPERFQAAVRISTAMPTAIPVEMIRP